MTEKEKMTQAIQDYYAAKQNPEQAALNAFLRESLDALKPLVAAVKDNPFFAALREEEDEDIYEEDAIVLYAEPGKAACLIEEEEAIDEILITRKVSGFRMHFITEELMAVYPDEYSCKQPDGSVLVEGPLYICHPIIGETEDANSDLSAIDFCEAMSYLSTHTIKTKADGVLGFLLDKED